VSPAPVNWVCLAARVPGVSLRPVEVNGGPGTLYLDGQQPVGPQPQRPPNQHLDPTNCSIRRPVYRPVQRRNLRTRALSTAPPRGCSRTRPATCARSGSAQAKRRSPCLAGESGFKQHDMKTVGLPEIRSASDKPSDDPGYGRRSATYPDSSNDLACRNPTRCDVTDETGMHGKEKVIGSIL
jgi:hypothetical protein